MKETYYGGTDITLEKLCKVMPSCNIDGTTYKTEDWIKECAVIDNLKIGQKIFIPYGGCEDYGILKEIVWDKFNFKGKGLCTDETKDWWYYEPTMMVSYFKDGEEHIYYVYEYSFYIGHTRFYRDYNRKSKRKFFSMKEMAEVKKNTAIENQQKLNII